LRKGGSGQQRGEGGVGLHGLLDARNGRQLGDRLRGIHRLGRILILYLGDSLGYVIFGKSQRCYLGTGSVYFGSAFRALYRINYAGPIVFESFSSAVVSATLSNTLGIWRNLWSDGDDLAAHANRFIRDQLAAVQTIELH
jgi:sugar phosphate isomerase/epimerase